MAQTFSLHTYKDGIIVQCSTPKERRDAFHNGILPLAIDLDVSQVDRIKTQFAVNVGLVWRLKAAEMTGYIQVDDLMALRDEIDKALGRDARTYADRRYTK